MWQTVMLVAFTDVILQVRFGSDKQLGGGVPDLLVGPATASQIVLPLLAQIGNFVFQGNTYASRSTYCTYIQQMRLGNDMRTA